VVRIIGHGKRVLDVGCAGGHIAQALRNRGNTVVGIELDRQAAAKAGEFCERVIVADLDAFDFDALGEDRFDVVLASDVLEHLKDPVRVLKRLGTLVADDGIVVLSLPNVAHASVRLALMQGSFPYADVGLLDRTHLRFFTRGTVLEAVAHADLEVIDLHTIDAEPEAGGVPFDPAKLPPGVMESVREDPDARVFQFIVVAVPTASAGYPVMGSQASVIARQLARARDEASESQAEAERLRADLTAMRVRIDSLAEQHRATLEQYRMLADEHRAASEGEAELRGALAGALAGARRLEAIERSRAWRSVATWYRIKRALRARRG
jgi:2-polyprenyl-3-methyl-5-hydroxy-6-metoxy-1,4-benzoquinol methylase